MTEAITIKGLDEQGNRISSKDFEDLVQEAFKKSSKLILETYGQHNVGGRLNPKGKKLDIHIKGPAGQRLGCMGMPGATIICHGSASDDVGYLNIGADIIVHGDATNGVCNAMAEGRVMIGGSIGARGLTMTKWNPEYRRPELWVLVRWATPLPNSTAAASAWSAASIRKHRKMCSVTGPVSVW